MKPAQVSIYRVTERLLLWAVPIVERLPKSLPYQVMGRKVIEDIEESLDLITLALQSDGGDGRLQLLDLLTVRMTSVRTHFRILSELKALSLNQHAAYLEFATSIASQLGAWRKKTRETVAGTSHDQGYAK